jgi:hypothetical protein
MGCTHRVLQIVVAQPGYAVAAWIGDVHHACEIEQAADEININPVTLWLLVEHALKDDDVFQSIEPWSAAPYIYFQGLDEEDRDLECNTNAPGNAEDRHGNMRIFGLEADVRTRIGRLIPDTHPQMHQA